MDFERTVFKGTLNFLKEYDSKEKDKF